MLCAIWYHLQNFNPIQDGGGGAKRPPDVMDRNYDVITFFQNTFILRRPGVAIFADIIKIVTMIIKTILKDSRKVRRITDYVSKWNLYLYFLI